MDAHSEGLCTLNPSARVVVGVGNNTIDAHTRVHSAHKLSGRGGANMGDEYMDKMGGCGRTSVGEDKSNTKTGGYRRDAVTPWLYLVSSAIRSPLSHV